MYLWLSGIHNTVVVDVSIRFSMGTPKRVSIRIKTNYDVMIIINRNVHKYTYTDCLFYNPLQGRQVKG